jgi:hypothetical protein
MRQLLRTLALSALFYVVLTTLMPLAAFAQAPAPTPSPTPTVNMATAVTLVLSALLGLITQMIQTGTFLGQWVTPKSWLPTLTVLATFFGGVVSYLTQQTPLVVDGTTVFYAVMTGITTLFAGAVPAIAVHAHVVIPGQVQAQRAANAASAAATPPAPPKAGQAGFVRGSVLGCLTLVGVLSVVLVPGMTRPQEQQTVAAAQQMEEVEQVQPAQAPLALAEVQPAMAGQGCSWFQGNAPAVTNSAAQIAMCVFEQILQGITQPLTIADSCGNVALSQILSVLDSILNFYTTPSDAGAWTMCGVGTPPIMGAGNCLTPAVISQVSAARSATAAKMAETAPKK